MGSFSGFTFPPDGESYYVPLSEKWWRVVLEAVVLLLTTYFFVVEVRLMRRLETSHSAWIAWRCNQLENDLKFCHPRWPEEEKFVRSELVETMCHRRAYFRDPWAIFEWMMYMVVVSLVFTRVMSETSHELV